MDAEVRTTSTAAHRACAVDCTAFAVDIAPCGGRGRSRAVACHHPGVDLAERKPAVRDGTGCRHPWETERARFFRVLIDRHMGGAVPRRTLDVGAGDGWFAGELPWAGAAGTEIVCWDVNYSRDELDADLGAGIVRTTDGPDGPFDLVLLLDVIEHIDDDGGFLDAAVIPHLTPSSLVVVGVPAYQRLFTSHDEALAHHRRYSPERLADLLTPRLEIVSRGGLFASLLPVRAAAALRERVAGPPDDHGVGDWSHGPAFTRVVRAALAADARAGGWLADHGRPTPGLSTWAVCRPRGSGDARG